MTRIFFILLLLVASSDLSFSKAAETLGANVSNMEVIEGFVLVEAHINGQQGRFILDTGSPDLVLNSCYFSGEKTDIIARGLHGQVTELAQVSVRQFDWMSIRKRYIQAVALNMANLEKQTKVPILGLIGYELLREHELLIDYKNQRIELIPVTNEPALSSRLLARLPFQMQGHLPVIEVNIGGYHLRMGLDSGAQSNLLDNELLGIIPEELLLAERSLQIGGLEKQVKQVPVRELSKFSLGKSNISGLYFAFVPLGPISIQQDLPIDGLLGYPFLSKAKVSINYAEGVLCFYE